MESNWFRYYLSAVCVIVIIMAGLVVPVLGEMGPALAKTDIPGNDIVLYLNTGALACADFCDWSPHCRAATYFTPKIIGQTKYCYHKELQVTDQDKVQEPWATSFVKKPYYYEGAHFPETINLEGTVSAGDGKDFVPTSKFPIGVYREMNPIFSHDPEPVKLIDTIYPDAKGHFTYKYTDNSDPYYWEFVSFRPVVPSQSYFMLSPSITGDSYKSTTTGLTNPSSRADNSLVYDLYALQNGVPITTQVTWKIIEPTSTDANVPYNIAGSLQQKGAQAHTGTKVNEQQLSEVLSNKGPDFRIYLEHGYMELDYHDALFDPDCFSYISLNLKQDGTLWKYMKQEKIIVSDHNPAGSGMIIIDPEGTDSRPYIPKIGCKSTGDTSTTVDLINCNIWNLEIKNKLPVQCYPDFSDINHIYLLLSYTFRLDYSKLGKNDPPLKGQYLGFQPIDPKDIVYLQKSDGSRVDSSGIAARSSSNRIYADLWFLGDCNRDYTVNLDDLSTIQDIAGKPALFDTICDMNGDRVIDQQDTDLLIKRLGNEAMKGDCDGNYVIDTADIGYLKEMLAKNTGVDYMGGGCDMNGDGQITQADLDLLNLKLNLNQKIGKAGSSGKQTSSTNGTQQSSSGSSIPDGQAQALPQAHGIKSLVGKESITPGAQPISWIDRIVFLPQTIMSVVHLAPAPAPETQTAERETVVSMMKEPSSGNPDESMQVVVLPPPVELVKEQSAIMQDSVQIVQISDQPNSIQPPPDIPQYTGSGNGTLLEEAPTQIYQISLPSDSAGNWPQTGPLTISCPAGSVLCQAGCVDIMTDTSNCGSCNNACSSGYLCFLGECQPKCPGGQTFCNGTCTSLLTDPNNCGACGHACTNGGSCGNGQCVLPMVKTLRTGPGDNGMVRQHL